MKEIKSTPLGSLPRRTIEANNIDSIFFYKSSFYLILQ